jgi:hypothetical protein
MRVNDRQPAARDLFSDPNRIEIDFEVEAAACRVPFPLNVVYLMAESFWRFLIVPLTQLDERFQI